jgi:hypothetical protein
MHGNRLSNGASSRCLCSLALEDSHLIPDGLCIFQSAITRRLVTLCRAPGRPLLARWDDGTDNGRLFGVFSNFVSVESSLESVFGSLPFCFVLSLELAVDLPP